MRSTGAKPPDSVPASTTPYFPVSSGRIVITPITDASSRAATSAICFITGTRASIRSSASSTANGSSSITCSAQSTAWPRPSASVWRM